MIKLQYFLFFWLIGLVHGRSKFLAGWLCCLTVLILASASILGINNVMQYPHALLYGETGQQVSGVSSFMMQNLRGELVLLLKGDSPLVFKSVLALFALSLLAVLYLSISKLKDRTPRSFEVVTALAIMIALLSSPHTHTQDYMLLSVAGVLLWNWLKEAKTEPGARRRNAIRKIFIFFPAFSWLLFYLQPLLMLLAIQPFFISLMVLSILLFWQMQSGSVRASLQEPS
jgi:hypothetical protein